MTKWSCNGLLARHPMQYIMCAFQNHWVCDIEFSYEIFPQYPSRCERQLTVFAEQSQWLVEKNQGQPFTYQFTNEASQRNSSDSIFCHFYFSPSTMGNTVVWEFLNQAGPDIRTWEGPPTPSSSTSTSSAVRTTTTVIPTHPKPTSSPTSTTSSSGGGLSTGASAGIGVGVGIAVLAIVAALFFFLRRSKPKQNPEQDTQWHQYSPTVVDYKHGYQANSNRAPTFRSEVDGNPAPVELGGSSPEFELPSPATKRG